MASEGGGEDEGGEGDAVGDQDDWEVPSATRANNGQLSSREFCIIVVPNSNSTLIKVQFILFCSSKINVNPVIITLLWRFRFHKSNEKFNIWWVDM